MTSNDFHVHSLVWVANDAKRPETWRKARVLAVDTQRNFTLQYEDTNIANEIKHESFLEPAEPREHHAEDLPVDLTRLSYLNCPSIYDLVQARFHAADEDGIYTNAGPVLIAVNPCRELGIYSQAVQQEYIAAYNASWTNSKALDDRPPHVYLVAAQAYKQMAQLQQNQAVVVTGESGAGKTESTKLMMRFLSALSGGSGLAERMLQSNPILEAFGNACTARNPNSSRFGKLLSIHFRPSAPLAAPPISGASMKTYLLEKSRVVHPARPSRPGDPPLERNYHIFYMMLRGASLAQREQWCLPPASDPHPAQHFAYLRNGLQDVQGRDDTAEWEDMLAAMQGVGLRGAQQQDVLQLVAGVLWLGNVEFCDGAGGYAVVAPGEAEGALEMAAKLLRVEMEELRRALTHQVLRSVNTEKRYSAVEAAVARDSLAKAVYGDLFAHIVAVCNSQLQQEPCVESRREADRTIAVLDIFGFENFGHNSFEQLCINYANERLQQLFCRHMLRREQEEYEAEGVAWQLQDTTDNSATIDLLHKTTNPLGVLTALNDACLVGGGEGRDEDLARLLRQLHRTHPAFFARPQNQAAFGIKHFADEVEYQAVGMVDKNKDMLPPELMELMASSSSPLLAQWGGLRRAAAQEASRRRVGSRSKQLVAHRFMTEVTDLMEYLGEAQLHFVRCIKPNPTLRPQQLDPRTVVCQLKWAGVMEVASIYQRGFPTRYTRTAVLKRYNEDLYPEGQQVAGGHPDNMCREVLAQHGLQEGTDFVMGTTKVFFRAGRLAQLEDRWQRRKWAVAVIWSAWSQRRLHIALSKWVEQWMERRKKEKGAAVRIQRWYRSCRTRRRWTFMLRQLGRVGRARSYAQRHAAEGPHRVAAEGPQHISSLPEDPRKLFPAADAAAREELAEDRAWLEQEALQLCHAEGLLHLSPASRNIPPPHPGASTSTSTSALHCTWDQHTAQELRVWLATLLCAGMRHPDQQLLYNLGTSLDQYATVLDQALRRLLQLTGGCRPDSSNSRAATEVQSIKARAVSWCSKFECRVTDSRCHLRRVQIASTGCQEAEAAAQQLLHQMTQLRDSYFYPWKGQVLDALEELEPLRRPTHGGLPNAAPRQLAPPSLQTRASARISAWMPSWHRGQ